MEKSKFVYGQCVYVDDGFHSACGIVVAKRGSMVIEGGVIQAAGYLIHLKARGGISHQVWIAEEYLEKAVLRELD